MTKLVGQDPGLLPRPAAAGEAQAAPLPLRHSEGSVIIIITHSFDFNFRESSPRIICLKSCVFVCRRNLESWRRELEDILDVAADDSEPWVQMLSELMKTYPSSGEVELNSVARTCFILSCAQCWVN